MTCLLSNLDFIALAMREQVQCLTLLLSGSNSVGNTGCWNWRHSFNMNVYLLSKRFPTPNLLSASNKNYKVCGNSCDLLKKKHFSALFLFETEGKIEEHIEEFSEQWRKEFFFWKWSTILLIDNYKFLYMGCKTLVKTPGFKS